MIDSNAMRRGVVRYRGDAEEAPAASYRGRKDRGKKDRRRWCRGKLGVEHELTWQPDHGWRAAFPDKERWIEVEACQKCGKIFHYRWNGGERWRRRVRKGKL